ncbi:tRNA guanosine(34) transglycosylase Tgt [Oceanispirochaeta sp.]|jgi:queuine tRNA-ribosyltransferase|uniref:tRNA guanosine(34) transglycosylase Tgt n=1 Tax=Oceanispirochaeta sp. TaxID=2035350 RepID=UPI002615EB3A|nr:tRNA guanosine(34) transglycosylase Tgt [Oceanispirochaeta sp.]MDA3957269.1 tRNA guanosine(34) transglycosylase Tgt [Oceanispirochaeta sp.]
MIDIQYKDPSCKGRGGILHLPHGDVEIPAFMPVGTNGTVKAVKHDSVDDMGYTLILGNTYHLYLRPGMDVIKAAGGLHNFSSWKHNILTDSGGFQVFSLAPFRKIREEGVRFRSHIDGAYHEFTPEKVVEIQEILGSDVQMALDICTEPGISHKEAIKALEITTRWASRAKKRWENCSDDYDGKLFGIIQGNFFEDLRKRSAEEILELDTPGIAIGGLSVGESPEMFRDYLHYTSQFLPDDKPRYVMGIGTPDYMLEAVEAGIDMFDCVYPTRIARNGTCFSLDGNLALKNEKFRLDQQPIEPSCTCPVCQQYSRSYLRHLFKAKEILGPMLVTEHNLHFLYQFMAEVRQSLREGRFLQYKKSFLDRFGKR